MNPLDSSSRWYLAARAFALRQGASLGFGMQNLYPPNAPDPTETLSLNSRLGAWTGTGVIKVDVWVPSPHKKFLGRPAIINFHGGGFVLGQGTDDARWAAAAIAELDAVVFAVNYRLAPGYPFPKPIEDCVDAVLQIVEKASKFNIDPEQITLSGFSAGGNLALASWLVLEEPERWDCHLPSTTRPKLAGLALFYPLLDWTISRPRKRARSIRPEMTLPSTLTDLFDASYIYPPLPIDRRNDWRLSPGLMPDELLDRLPPLHLCLCEYDMLLTEGLMFAERLELRGRPVTVRVVLAEKHAWDKPPPFAPKESSMIEYGQALKSIKGWLQTVVESKKKRKEGGLAAT